MAKVEKGQSRKGKQASIHLEGPVSLEIWRRYDHSAIHGHVVFTAGEEFSRVGEMLYELSGHDRVIGPGQLHLFRILKLDAFKTSRVKFTYLFSRAVDSDDLNR